MCIAESRPRRMSGVASWRIVLRSTALYMSAAPAIARNSRASGNENVTSPNAVIASPQTRTARITPRPRYRTRPTQPVNSDPSSAPAAGAAVRNPSPSGPVLKTSSARIGNSASGIPKIMALRSMTKVERMTGTRRTKRNPSRTAPRPGRATSPSGGSGRISSSPTSAALKLTESRR